MDVLVVVGVCNGVYIVVDCQWACVQDFVNIGIVFVENVMFYVSFVYFVKFGVNEIDVVVNEFVFQWQGFVLYGEDIKKIDFGMGGDVKGVFYLESNGRVGKVDIVFYLVIKKVDDNGILAIGLYFGFKVVFYVGKSQVGKVDFFKGDGVFLFVFLDEFVFYVDGVGVLSSDDFGVGQVEGVENVGIR